MLFLLTGRVLSDRTLRSYGTCQHLLHFQYFLRDIGMMRDDFERFISIIGDELPNQLKLRWITNDKKYYLPFAKIENINTAFMNEETYDSNFDFGIYVDVFPIDSISKMSNRVKIRKSLIHKISVIRYYKSISWKHSMLKKLVCMLAAPFASQSQLHKVQTKLMIKENNKRPNFTANYGSNYKIVKQSVPLDVYGEGKRIFFENRLYNAPNEPELVLKTLYGNNFMELPPVEKRITHEPIYVKFSDGTEMRFDK